MRIGRKLERPARIACDASRVGALRVELGPVDVVRADRVAALRAALATGRFRVDPRETAEMLLRDVLTELLS
jgi:anti-sigma28 factor (negative regulator of flagellin synthesis)